jgi:hypothetical protein
MANNNPSPRKAIRTPDGQFGSLREIAPRDPALDPLCTVFQKTVTGNDKAFHVAGKDNDAKEYGLHAHQPCEMPLRHALYFLPHDDFKVVGPDGRQMKFDVTPDDSESVGLPAHKVVATLDELTLEALVIRAQRLPAGKRASRNWGKEALAKFIMDGREIMLGNKRLVAANPDDEGGDPDDEVELEDEDEEAERGPAAEGDDGAVDDFVKKTQAMPPHLQRVNQNNQRG